MHERDRVIGDGIRRREGRGDPAGMRGIDRIEIAVVDRLAYEARNPHEPDGLMRIGEPVERGGSGVGASPLSHFLTGVGACLLNQFVRVSIAEGYPLAFSGASVRGQFRREVGGAFQRIRCEVRGSGSIADETARELTRRAERLCYVHRTLVATVEMTTVLVLDGREAVHSVEGPAPLT